MICSFQNVLNDLSIIYPLPLLSYRPKHAKIAAKIRDPKMVKIAEIKIFDFMLPVESQGAFLANVEIFNIKFLKIGQKCSQAFRLRMHKIRISEV